MKKTIFISFLIMLTLWVKAQIFDPINYQICWNETFEGNRSWNTNTFFEQSNDPNFIPRWDCMIRQWWPYCVTTGENTHQAYQTTNARFGSDNRMRLVAECISNSIPLACDDPNGYSIPYNACCSCTINGHEYLPHENIFYYSGTIETIADTNWFGYYEIKCQLPVHDGEGAAFWLVGSGPSTYEEIDIFEHSIGDCHITGNLSTDFSCGIWFNPNGTNYVPTPNNNGAQNYSKRYLTVPINNNLTNEHTYGLEWLPNRVTWYFDGIVIHECTDSFCIPQHRLNLKVTHPVKSEALDPATLLPYWTGSDEVIIDNIKFYKLISDCNTDVNIRNTTDINDYTPGIKHSIIMGSSNGITFPTNTKLIMRAENNITITSGVTIPSGADVTLMVHPCVNY